MYLLAGGVLTWRILENGDAWTLPAQRVWIAQSEPGSLAPGLIRVGMRMSCYHFKKSRVIKNNQILQTSKGTATTSTSANDMGYDEQRIKIDLGTSSVQKPSCTAIRIHCTGSVPYPPLNEHGYGKNIISRGKPSTFMVDFPYPC